MADFGDDPFGEATFTSAPSGDVPVVPAIVPTSSATATEALDLEGFEEAPAATPADANGNGLADVIQLTTAESQAAFIGGYVPHPVHEAAAPAAAPAAVDPRIEWSNKNADIIKKKEADETASKKVTVEAAKTHLAKVTEARKKLLDSRKKANRDAETVSPEAGVPKGTPWEKVNLLINFSAQDKIHAKDMSRFKSTLNTCKTLNVGITAK
mmetsp:Transcript_35498/g.78753  ORF Transcript_35498/g.78753 Transcript_35498/m.78753 type:complete len:211 (+) Transcript_35498:107-739(+)